MESLGTDFDALLTRGALLALAAAGCWAVVVLTAIAVEAGTRGRVRIAEHAGCPPALRLWLLGLFVALFAGVAPANASNTGSGSGPAGSPADPAVGAALDGLPLPERTTGAPPRRSAPESGRAVVVRPGDSLWRIVRELLPADRSDAEVAEAVAAVHAANRHTIGADPDLLIPGQRLVVDTLIDFPSTTTLSEEP